MPVLTEKTAREIELDLVLGAVAEHARSPIGRAHVLALRPRASRADILRELDALEEMVALLAEEPSVAFPTALDFGFARQAAKPGTVLAPDVLVSLRDTYRTVSEARAAITTAEGEYPILGATIGRLPYHELLHERLEEVFDDRGEVADGATSELAVLRDRERTLKRRIERVLERLIEDPRQGQHLSESFFTQLGERYVVLVKVDHKGRIPGIVHGESSSGLSLKVEPLVIHDDNNALVEVRLDVAREVRRILRELSERVLSYAADYAVLVELMAWLESVAARARWARDVGGARPDLDEGLVLRLVRARHPLLGQRCVPIDMELLGADRVVVLSGVNAGGKTVTLKTCGLLCALAQAGLYVPAAEGTRLPVFDGIHSEIGDQQSLSANLSSFSSHVTHVAGIVGGLQGRSLCLFDEFMTGTDPDEGAALAEAILLELASREAVTLVTTHYGALKLLAKKYEGFRNVAVEFDMDRLQPTYRLLADVPGTSLGIAIAGRFGVSPTLVERARTLVDSSQEALGRMMADLEAALATARRRGEDLEAAQRAAREAEAALTARLATLEVDLKRALAEAKEAHATELERLKGEVLAAIRERGRPDPSLPSRIHARVQEVEREAGALAPGPAQVRVGDTVEVVGMRDQGIVVEVSPARGRAIVQVGPVSVRADLRSLRPVGPPDPGGRQGLAGRERGAPAGRGERGPSPGPGQTRVDLGDTAVGLELHLLGMRVEEALEALEEYIDRAYARGLKEVRIVHGRGTGALRRAVEEYLKGCPLVGAYRPGGAHEGSWGATVVTLGAR